MKVNLISAFHSPTAFDHCYALLKEFANQPLLLTIIMTFKLCNSLFTPPYSWCKRGRWVGGE
jgi:hypothetical protein